MLNIKYQKTLLNYFVKDELRQLFKLLSAVLENNKIFKKTKKKNMSYF